MKIIILSDDFPPKSGGGAAIIASTHARALYNKGYDVSVITTIENKSEIGESNEKGIKIIRLYSKYDSCFRSYLSLYNPFILYKVKKILEKEKPDIVHAHNIHYHLSYHTLYLAKKYAKAVFITIHDSMPFHYSKFFPKDPYTIPVKSYKVSLWLQLKDFRFRFNPIKNMIVRYYLRLPSKIFAVSTALKNALSDNEIDNVEVINNGIDITRWVSDENSVNEFRKKYNLFDKKVIMFCGRLSRAKGGELLVNCISDIIKSIPDAVLLIVGEKDKEAKNMLNKATELNIDTKLVFTGKLTGNALITAYGASNVLVVPSLCFDWFPTVNLEAMVMRLPIVATIFGGSSEAVKDEINGYIVNPYNKEEIVSKIVNILKDYKRAQEFGKNGFEILQKEFSIVKYIDTIFFWYNKFL